MENTLNLSTRYYQSVFEAQIDKDTVDSTRQITFVIASEATGRAHRNRYVYNWDNWQLDNYASNPIVAYQHRTQDELFMKASPDDIIGTSEAWVDKFKGSKSLMAKATFEPAEINAQAEKIFQKVKFKSLRSASVGVLPTGPVKTEYFRNEKNEIVDLAFNLPGQELIEWSIVNIPADPAAVRKSSMELIQQSILDEISKYVPDIPKKQLASMKVSDIMDLLAQSQGADPDLNKYINRLKALKK